MTEHVYVIRLADEVKNSAKFRQRNPDMQDDGRCFYVGRTSHDPECRFEQHIRPKGASISCHCYGKEKTVQAKYTRFTREYAIQLVPGRYEKHNPIRPAEGETARKQAKRYEEWLSRKLRDIGHGVWSNPPDFDNSKWAPP